MALLNCNTHAAWNVRPDSIVFDFQTLTADTDFTSLSLPIQISG